MKFRNYIKVTVFSYEKVKAPAYRLAIWCSKVFLKRVHKIFDKWKDKEYFAIFEVNHNGVPMGDIEWLDIDDYFK